MSNMVTCSQCPNLEKCVISAQSKSIDAIATRNRIVDYKKDDVILPEGQRSSIVGVVIDGALRSVVTQADGRQQVLGIHLPNSIFSHPFQNSTRYGVEAATHARVCIFDRQTLEQQILATPDLQHAIFLSILEDFGAAKALVSILGSLRLPERIARFFLHMARGDGDGDQELSIPVSRRDLAALLGTTQETISRFVQEMVRNDILHVKNPNTLIILDRPKLEMFAGLVTDEVSALPHGLAVVRPGPGPSGKPIDIVARMRSRQSGGGAAERNSASKLDRTMTKPGAKSRV